MNGGVYRASHLCPHCFFEHAGGKASKRGASLVKAMASSAKVDATPNELVEGGVAVNAEVAKAEKDKSVSNVHEFSSSSPNNDESPLEAVSAAAVATQEQAAVQKVDAQEAKTARKPEPIEQKPVQQSKPVKQQPVQGKAQGKVQEKKAVQQQKPVKQDLPKVKKTATVKPLSFEEPKLDIGKRVRAQANQPIALNTKPVSDQNVVAILDDVTAECVLNVELTPDLFTKGKFTGAKSERIKAALLQGKKNALAELREKARDMDANMVAGIAIKNSMKAIDEKTAANVTVKASGVALIVEVAGEALEA